MTSTTQDEPDEVAWIHRMGHWGLRVMALVLLLALTFTMVNVQQFSAHSQPASWWWWSISWLLDPMASITMAAAIVFEGFLADHHRRVGWLTATKWYAGIAVWAMNVWDPLVHVVPSGVLLHSVAPGIVVGLAEAAPRVRRHMADIVTGMAPTPVVVPEPTPVVVVPPAPHPVVTHPAPTPVVAPPRLAPRPAPAPTGGVTPELLGRARKLRATRTREGQSCGRRVLMAELGVSDRVARDLTTQLNTDPQLEAVG